MSECDTVTAKYKLVDYNVPTAGRLAALLFTYKGIAFEYIQVDKMKAHEHETGKFTHIRPTGCFHLLKTLKWLYQ